MYKWNVFLYHNHMIIKQKNENFLTLPTELHLDTLA